MEQEPLTSVFAGLRGKILQFASRFFPSEEEAEDALQDAFCRLWSRRNAIATTSQAEALAKTTVRNMGIDAYRRRQTGAATVELCEAIATDADVSDEADDETVEERFERVRRTIDRCLSPVQRRVVQMHDFEQVSFEEIAASLDMQVAAVRMQLSRARKKIRECYNQQQQ